MSVADLIWTIIGFLLTVLVLSYIFLGDNPLFRVATYVFIGVAAGYLALVTFNQVIWPKVFLALLLPDSPAQDKVLLLIPLVLSVLLVAKLFPKLAQFGNVSMAYLVGVGAAVVIGGAVLGTLVPQGAAAANQFNFRSASSDPGQALLTILIALVTLGGTIATLFYFYFSARQKPNQLPERNPMIEMAAQAGQVFIAITLGAVFAGVYSSALTALIERLISIFSLFVRG